MNEVQLDLVFAALSDPTRRAILARLAQGEATVTELAEPFDMSLPAVSKHLKVLIRAGLMSQSRNAQWIHSRLEPASLDEARGWIDAQRALWDETYSRLDDLLLELQGNDVAGLNESRSEEKDEERS